MYNAQQHGGYPPPLPPPKKRKVWPWVVGGIVVVIAIGSAANSGRSTTTYTPPAAQQPAVKSPVTQEAAPVASGPLTTVSDGTYDVGVDMVAGKYKTPGSDEGAIMGCGYFVKDTPNFGYSKGQGILTVKNGQQLTLTGDCTWSKQ